MTEIEKLKADLDAAYDAVVDAYAARDAAHAAARDACAARDAARDATLIACNADLAARDAAAALRDTYATYNAAIAAQTKETDR
jgi:hypothetical protein